RASRRYRATATPGLSHLPLDLPGGLGAPLRLPFHTSRPRPAHEILEAVMKSLKIALLLALAACAVIVVAPTNAQAPKGKRINRAIELVAQDQPIYYTGSHSGTAGTFEQGKADAQTYADYLSYDM